MGGAPHVKIKEHIFLSGRAAAFPVGALRSLPDSVIWVVIPCFPGHGVLRPSLPLTAAFHLSVWWPDFLCISSLSADVWSVLAPSVDTVGRSLFSCGREEWQRVRQSRWIYHYVQRLRGFFNIMLSCSCVRGLRTLGDHFCGACGLDVHRDSYTSMHQCTYSGTYNSRVSKTISCCRDLFCA